MTKLEIINETIAHYSEDTSRRALDIDGQCQYSTDGKECAVGRCMLYNYKNRKSLENIAVGGLLNVLHLNTIDDVLEEKYRGHDISFWELLQNFHDREDNWCKTGLTDNGVKSLKNIKNLYKNED